MEVSGPWEWMGVRQLFCSAPFCSQAGFHLLLYPESPGARQVKLSEYHSPYNLFPIPSIPWDTEAVS